MSHEKENVVFYHGNCTDGFGGAYSAWKKLGDNATYVPLEHAGGLSLDQLPNLKDKNVYIIDFSFEKDLYEEVLKIAKNVQLLDHHKSAYQKLCGCKGCFFDLNRSGAMIAWQYFNPDVEPPYFIKLIQDGDLWKFKYEDTNPFYRAIHMMEEKFEVWQQLENEDFISKTIEDGKLLNRFYMSQVEEIAKEAKSVMINGQLGLGVNGPRMFASELGNVLAKRSETFALIWHERPEYVKCSLRSVPEYDCSEIAAVYGGGGHPQSASFTLPSLQKFLEVVEFPDVKKLNNKPKI